MLRHGQSGVALGGEAVSDDLLAHTSPLGWSHINLTGDYVWDGARVPNLGKFRPLQSGAIAA